MEINGNNCELVETISYNGNEYYYFCNEKDVYDIYILKKKIIDGEENLVSIPQMEFLNALSLYYEKHKNDNFNETAE